MAISDSTLSASSRGRSHDRTLGDAIAAATRGIHARLNKSIIARLPLAIPPRASDPSTYVTGILHIAPIYITFEGLWRHLLDLDSVDPHAELFAAISPAADRPLVDASPPSARPVPSQGNGKLPARVHSVLHALSLPGLMRGESLKFDIQALTGWSDHVVESQLQIASQTPQLAAMIDHMTKSIREKPLLLVTYTYIMYMALFAGGRFIRATLESAGDDFWRTPLAPIKPTMQHCVPTASENRQGVDPKTRNETHKCRPLPLSFFHFDTPHDGEDLKVEYKRRLRICSSALEPHEVDDIVQEATQIFEHMTCIVNQLDTLCEDEASDNDAVTTPGDSLSAMPLISRLRDSVAVAKERHARQSPRTSSSEGDSVGTVIRRRAHRSSASSESRTSGSVASEHPLVPAVIGVEVSAAAVARSVRFDSNLATPQKGEQGCRPEKRNQGKTADLITGVLAVLLSIVAVGVILVYRKGSTE